MPVILIGIAGEIPSRTVISGTIARRMNIQEGYVYLFQAEELEEDVMYGRQFNFMAISKELSAIETLQASEFVGKLRIVNVENPEPILENTEAHLELQQVLA